MLNFKLGETNECVNSNEENEIKGPFDAIVEAAGGKSLPGKWGLIQALLNIWTNEKFGHPALFYTKNILNSVGVIREYKKSQKDSGLHVKKNLQEEFFKKNNLEKFENFQGLDSMIFVYSKDFKRKDFLLEKDEKKSFYEDLIREISLPTGLKYYFTIHKTFFYGHEKESFSGPYMKKDDIQKFQKEFSALLWNKSNDRDLQLSMKRIKLQYDVDWTFVLENIGKPGDYISGTNTWKNLEKLSNRVSKLKKSEISRNILFYGPPGTGKTTLARNLARKLGQGKTLRIDIRAINEAGMNAIMTFVKFLNPHILLFDDIDRHIGQFVELLHFLEKSSDATSDMWVENMTIIATVNSVESLDPALLRPGRFDEVIQIDEPDDDTRAKIIDHYMKKMKIGDWKKIYQILIDRTKGFSPADIKEVIQCISVLGEDHAESEIDRVSRQRKHYSDDSCNNFAFNKKKWKSSTLSEEPATPCFYNE